MEGNYNEGQREADTIVGHELLEGTEPAVQTWAENTL